jgi:hypothetical protein
MSQLVLTLDLPDEVYERVRRTAKGMKQPLHKALSTIVQAATPSLAKVPLQYRAELEAMEDFSDEELWHASERRLAHNKQRRLNALLEKNKSRELSAREQKTLAELRTEADQLTLHRAYAFLLLKYRGNGIPNVTDLKQ